MPGSHYSGRPTTHLNRADGLLTAVHNWVESLYTATEHFRCFGDVGDIPVNQVEESLIRRM